jgi:DNA-binding NtrC family response regulator
MRHGWPYNVRELKQALAKAVALATSNVVELERRA